ncbi:RecA-family ATPase [Rhodobacter aestuarii]|uniref:RecA-family ATPase n=1 Tax=Rhodobacter aestuarii TaxID=453582 RepID=A0A1N7K520_9RHOB|nr:AAA family ATPase [Rhodobacter aestuarii]PTV95854.1 RecA-family ATPase [Rhodobacter aestuarii]SIS56702.1 RecA-family ATPase [Rhodobacter aestuarii]
MEDGIFNTPEARQALEDWRNERDRREGVTSTRAPLRQVHPPPDSTPAGCDDVPLTPLDAYGDMGEPARGEAKGSRFKCAADLEGLEVPERKWLVRDFIPGREVTLLYGDGGTGKSLLSAQLACAVALGRQWIGRGVTEGRAVFLSAEDEQDELHRRFADIVRSEGATLADLQRLTYASLAGEDALLARADGAGKPLIPSGLYDEIRAILTDLNPALLVLDTLADLFPGNENDKAQVRQFVGMLKKLALQHDCAVVMLAHPSLSGMASGSGTSGNTAWNGSARSRLYFQRVMVNGEEADEDARILSNKKLNYGRSGAEIAVTWLDGVFVADPSETGLDRMAKASKAERVFMKLLRMFTEQGRKVNSNSGPSYAPSQFASHQDNEGVTKDGFKRAMDSLLNAGKIAIEAGGSPSKPTTKLVEVAK